MGTPQESYLGVCDYNAAVGYDFTFEFWIRGYETLSPLVPE